MEKRKGMIIGIPLPTIKGKSGLTFRATYPIEDGDVILSVYVKGKFLGYKSDTFWSLSSKSPKHHPEKDIKMLVENFKYFWSESDSEVMWDKGYPITIYKEYITKEGGIKGDKFLVCSIDKNWKVKWSD